MKQLFVISCPIDTYSGYGARSRDIALSVINSDKYEVKIIPQRWGATPFGFLKAENPDHKKILDSLLQTPQLTRQPDIWMQITVPNEFQPVGKFNIGVTAGIETNMCDISWIDGCNRMNLNLVSSEHAKKVFQETKFQQINNQTQRVERVVELMAPIEVLFEGANTDIYKKIDEFKNIDLYDHIDSIPEDYAFLFVGHWLQGDLNEDRKNVSGLIRIFLETFKNKGNNVPALILKTQSVSPSVLDREEILNKIRAIQNLVGGKQPSIYLLHGDFSDEEINELYNHPKIKTFVSFTKGEGFGRPLLESSVIQKPILATNWSGHTDFLSQGYVTLLPGELTKVHPSAVVQNMILPEAVWFTVSEKIAGHALEDIFKNYKKYLEGAKRQAYRSRTTFSLEEMGKKLLSILEEKIPKQVQLKLPQLKKIELPKLKTE